MPAEFFTIGHSDRSIDEFIDLLRRNGIKLVVDVRRLPGSRKHPHFNDDALAASLRAASIEYRYFPGLGGRRPMSKEVDPTINAMWNNRSFRNYADHTLSEEFLGSLAELRETGAATPLTVMCSEAVWWRCHRRIIADQLIGRGDVVRHIMSPTSTVEAHLTPGSVVHPDGQVTYPDSETEG